MNHNTQKQRGYGFVIGLLAGTFVGAGLALWLAPAATAEIRERVADTARTLGKRASARYEQAGHRVGQAVNEITRKGNGVRDEVADSVARGAHEVERFAMAAKSETGKARS